LNNLRPKSNLSCADTSASDVFLSFLICFLLVKKKELKIKEEEEEEEVSWLGRAVMEVSCLHEVKTCQSVRVGSKCCALMKAICWPCGRYIATNRENSTLSLTARLLAATENSGGADSCRSVFDGFDGWPYTTQH
jgi:hypothetical protein